MRKFLFWASFCLFFGFMVLFFLFDSILVETLSPTIVEQIGNNTNNDLTEIVKYVSNQNPWLTYYVEYRNVTYYVLGSIIIGLVLHIVYSNFRKKTRGVFSD